MMISRCARQSLSTVALVGALGAFAAQGPARAQAFGYPPYGGPPPYGGYDDYGPPPGYGAPRGYYDQGPRYYGPRRRAGAPFASRRAIAGLLEDRGLRLEGPLDFEGPNIVAIGVEPDGRARRLVIDPYQGAVLAVRPLPRHLAGPGRDGPDDQPVWRDDPQTTGSISHGANSHGAKTAAHPAIAEAHGSAPLEKRKPAEQTAAAPAAAVPEAKAAPTGELEAPLPPSGG
ncbi:hypothetical protein [Methylocystis bryophila]|nr:hypothetical protein [Methylocystis bryophila]